jgi:ParB family chromosome partitioning protein
MNENLPYSQAVFWIETEKITPNPFQPRKEFNEEALQSLADSIRQYGVLQPLVVTRKESRRDDGGLSVTYELIAGERRLRASRIAGVTAVPAVIRAKEDNDLVKLELAIIENLQREDLNPIDRAQAFAQLANEFNLPHTDIAKKIGKSREYVSNSIRLLALPEHIIESLRAGKISEGHARALLMLNDRPEARDVLFRDITEKGYTVRDAESGARQAAEDKVRKKHMLFNKDAYVLEKQLGERLGTRVRIERKENGGKIMIDFFSAEDLDTILNALSGEQSTEKAEEEVKEQIPEQKKEEDDSLYSIKEFSI